VNGLTLGVETSGLAGAVALRRGGEMIETVSIEHVGRRHAQTLVSEVDALLFRHGFTARQLDLIAVSIGPGSFTGLRVGVVFAKTLAYAVGCRLAAIDTFRAIAAASPSDVSEVFVVSDAQRGDLFVGHYVRRSGDSAENDIASWTRPADISIEPMEAWCRRCAEGAASQPLIAVSGLAADSVRANLPAAVRVLGPECRTPQADLIAQLGEQQAQAGRLADLWTLEPFYLRRSAAEEKATG
jgi:tRNA threonylcarbamoyladenosine biosynthesis protein TsaB